MFSIVNKEEKGTLSFLTAGIKPASKEGPFPPPSDTIWHVFLQKFRRKLRPSNADDIRLEIRKNQGDMRLPHIPDQERVWNLYRQNLLH